MKTGDLIEVSDDNNICNTNNNWEKRIFIAKNEKYYCVNERHEQRYEEKQNFEALPWKYGREIKKPEYVPLTYDDYEKLKEAGWLRHKSSKDIWVIHGICKYQVYIGTRYYNYSELLEYFEFLDGAPCGKVKDEKE